MVAVAVALAVWSVAPTAQTQTVGSASDFVWVQPGAAPLVITAPHGGEAPLPDVARRQTGVRTQDAQTGEIARAVLADLDARHGLRAHGIAATFHRRYLDANRPADLAFEDPNAIPHYAAYHDAVRQAVATVRAAYPNGGLLVDLHGQARDVDLIHRGTQNGATMRRALDRHGPAALIGEASIFGSLSAQGFAVFPPNTSPGGPRESPSFSGGYTVQTYGSHQPDGIDALQIELGANYRTPETVATVARSLADAIASYTAHYLTSSQMGSPSSGR